MYLLHANATPKNPPWLVNITQPFDASYLLVAHSIPTWMTTKATQNLNDPQLCLLVKLKPSLLPHVYSKALNASEGNMQKFNLTVRGSSCYQLSLPFSNPGTPLDPETDIPIRG